MRVSYILIALFFIPIAFATITPQQDWNFRNFYNLLNIKDFSSQTIDTQSITLNGDTITAWAITGTSGNSNETLYGMFANLSQIMDNVTIRTIFSGSNGIVYDPNTGEISTTATNGTFYQGGDGIVIDGNQINATAVNYTDYDNTNETLYGMFANISQVPSNQSIMDYVQSNYVTNYPNNESILHLGEQQFANISNIQNNETTNGAINSSFARKDIDEQIDSLWTFSQSVTFLSDIIVYGTGIFYTINYEDLNVSGNANFYAGNISGLNFDGSINYQFNNTGDAYFKHNLLIRGIYYGDGSGLTNLNETDPHLIGTNATFLQYINANYKTYYPNNQTIANALINTTIARTNQIMNNITINNIARNLTGGKGILYYPNNGSIESTARNSSAIFNISLTSITYNGNITSGALNGYKAANAICTSAFLDAHLCTEFEVIGYVNAYNINYLNNTDAWVSTGSPKYIPADVPVNDCNGWKYSGVVTYLGNYWKFNSETGGTGNAINCGTSLSLACCRG